MFTLATVTVFLSLDLFQFIDNRECKGYVLFQKDNLLKDMAFNPDDKVINHL